jgi:ABC-2 type transport system ATP-binding protein
MENKPLVQIETDNTADAANYLSRNNVIVSDVTEQHIYLPYTSKQQMGEINTMLNQMGYVVYSINKQQQDLEKLFLAITQTA